MLTVLYGADEEDRTTPDDPDAAQGEEDSETSPTGHFDSVGQNQGG